MFFLVLVVLSTTFNYTAANKPVIQKLGTADFSMVETTPVVWKGNLLRFESVRKNYNSPTYPVPADQSSPCPGTSCFRFRKISNFDVTVPFGINCSFGCAYVQKGNTRVSDKLDTMWVFGNCADQKMQNITAFSSTDLINWKNYPQALKLNGFGHKPSDFKFYNTNVHDDKKGGTHIMAIELGSPSDITGDPFTTVFARHNIGDDLGANWLFMNPYKYVWPPLIPGKSHGYKGACPTIRYVQPYYYLFNLWAENGGYDEHVQRSKDLIIWEYQNKSILRFDQYDKGKPPRINTPYYYTNFTAEQEKFINESTDINNSDIDFVDVNGDIYISYSWGNQQGTEFLGSAIIKGTTTDEWCVSLFD
jgi:hypothetical protein